uniref:Alpha-1,3/1,6-mannosyltransferase ALG2 n=1 Tax=Trichuris muris TaxID=70415 RepID=A0A5S6QHJ2_TRIMR
MSFKLFLPLEIDGKLLIDRRRATLAPLWPIGRSHVARSTKFFAGSRFISVKSKEAGTAQLFSVWIIQMRILFCHPEFWLGGAEAVVFDIILALKEKGHSVYLATGHCDQFWLEKLQCNVDDMLCSVVSMAGDWFHGMQFVVWKAWLKWGRIFDLVVLDACPGAAPLLKLLFRRRIYYYCHFPYRMMIPRNRIDGLLLFIEMWIIEPWCLSFCDAVSTNSLYTTRIVHRYLPGMTNRNCKLLYPAVPSVTVNGRPTDVSASSSFKKVYFLSLNRYWPDKRIDVALSAFGNLRNLVDTSLWNSVSLVVAGSVERRLVASLKCKDQLHRMARDLGIEGKVIFLENITTEEKAHLLAHCRALVYTPPMEHFGIIPIEAAHFGKPVIAVNSCGCKETVNSGSTGLLVELSPQGFAIAMASLLIASKDELEKYSASCRQWIDSTFSLTVFKKSLFYQLELMN